MKSTLIISALLMGSLLITGCATISEGSGVVQNRAGVSSGSASFHIKEGIFDDDAKVTARLSNGEVYKGKFIINKTSGVEFGEVYNSKTKKYETTMGDVTHYSSKASGLLFGPKGKTLKCAMTLSNPSDGFGDGGIGECKLSTGQIIPLHFEEKD